VTASDASRYLRLLACVLAVPLVGAGIAMTLRWHAAGLFAGDIAASVAPGDPVPSGMATLADLCAGDDAGSYAACDADAGYRIFAAASLAAGGGGLVLLGGIALAGAAARRDRLRLLALFRPGLYVTAAVVTGLIVIHALIATVVLIGGVKAIAPGVPLIFGGAILAGALAGIRAVPRAVFGAVREARVFAFGGPVTRQDAPDLWRQVEATAARLGALPPDGIVVGLDINFFVTDAPVVTPNGPCQGRTLFCSLPLARILTVDEFTAIVAHELGHFRGEDTRFSERFYPIYRGTAGAIYGLAASGDGLRRLALLPALAIFGFFFERFAVAERRHSRERELVADRASVEATSARIAAMALVKVHACAPLWPGVLDETANTIVRDGEPVPNASALFAAAAARAAGPALLDGILATHTEHPTDTHPSLAVRLEALGVGLPEIAAEALQVGPATPASSLVPIGVRHEEALSMVVVAPRREGR